MSQQTQKDWMNESKTNRFGEVYRDGVRYFIEFAKANGYCKTMCPCPCAKCRNKYNREFELVKHHLYVNGIDTRYTMWALHGEKSTNNLMEQVKTTKEKRKSMSGEGSSSQLEIGSDALAEVLGLDVGKRPVQGYASHLSKKRPQQASLASLLMERGVAKSMASLEARIVELASQLEEMFDTMKGTTQTARKDGPPRPSPKIRSKSVRRSSHANPVNLIPQFEGEVHGNMNAPSGVSEKPYVNLQNRNGDVVATGYIVTDKEGEMCHDKKVLPGERKVRIEEVFDITAVVPNPPEGDGHFTLAGYVEGGWLIWPEAWLQQRS